MDRVRVAVAGHRFALLLPEITRYVRLTRRIAGRPPRKTTKDTAGHRPMSSDQGKAMQNRNSRMLVPIALFAVVAGLQCGAVHAAKSGDYFEVGPQCCAPDTDLSGLTWLEASTAEAFVNTKGILQLGSSTKKPLYAKGSSWISNSQYSAGGTLWNVAIGEAFRKSFSSWPTNRVRVRFDSSGTDCTGYLAAYSSRGTLLVQTTVTITSAATQWLDTGTTKGRIGYVLASYSGTGCGQLGTIGYWVSVH